LTAIRAGDATRDKACRPVSVIITTFDDGHFLADALWSVATQTVSAREILVVDDGSRPATAPAVIEEFVAVTGLDVNYHWQANSGPSAARNAGLRQTTQEYVAYLDADDRWLASHLEWKLNRLHERDRTYSTAYDGFVVFEPTVGRVRPGRPTRSYDGPIRPDLMGVPNGIPTGMPMQLHRRAALEAVGGFDDDLRFLEDLDLLLRLSKAGYWITGSGRPTLWRRVHLASLTQADPATNLTGTQKFLAKAEREGLLSASAIASKQKWLRLSIGKRQVLDGDNPHRGVEMIRQAFEFDRPSGFGQRAVQLAAARPKVGHPLFMLYRYLHARGRHLRGWPHRA
jgi:hypothetical protein